MIKSMADRAQELPGRRVWDLPYKSSFQLFRAAHRTLA